MGPRTLGCTAARLTSPPQNQRSPRYRLIFAGVLCGLPLVLVFGARAATPEIDGAKSEDTEITRGVDTREQIYSVPVIDGRGRTLFLKTRLCRPAGDGPSTLVSINHGSPPNAADRPKMKLGSCQQQAAQWFLSRGYVVAFALRRGYGETGGTWAEDQGGCQSPDYFRAGLETARDIDAVVNFATNLPFVKREGAVVVGQSAGGWGTIAYDSAQHPKVAAFIVMAGGRGGHRNQQPNNNCRTDLLVEAAKRYGASVSTPMLWIYAANDSYFGPPIVRAMWRGFTAAGGTGDLEQPGPYMEDGHHLFFGPGGSDVWGPLVERYLAEQHIH
jgi:dienelactone hydrolase